eukprot:6262282-Prymnesium_polylepis.2
MPIRGSRSPVHSTAVPFRSSCNVALESSRPSSSPRRPVLLCAACARHRPEDGIDDNDSPERKTFPRPTERTSRCVSPFTTGRCRCHLKVLLEGSSSPVCRPRSPPRLVPLRTPGGWHRLEDDIEDDGSTEGEARVTPAPPPAAVYDRDPPPRLEVTLGTGNRSGVPRPDALEEPGAQRDESIDRSSTRRARCDMRGFRQRPAQQDTGKSETAAVVRMTIFAV